MSIQLIDNTAQGVYGAAVIDELETLVKTQSWQLNYIAETGKFSILGCGPAINKQEIEAIFAKRKSQQYAIAILDSFSYGQREFTLTAPIRIAIPALQPVIDRVLQGGASPTEERARVFLADVLVITRDMPPEEPPLLLRLHRGYFSPRLQAAIERVLAGNARVELTWI